MKKEFAIMGFALMTGCVSSPPRLVNQNDAAVQFAKLGRGGKETAMTFYDLGAGDTVKRLYWSQRNGQQLPSASEATPVEKLHRRYVNIPSPPFQDADGVTREGSVHAVEIVQWVSAVTKNGKKINLCR